MRLSAKSFAVWVSLFTLMDSNSNAFFLSTHGRTRIQQSGRNALPKVSRLVLSSDVYTGLTCLNAKRGRKSKGNGSNGGGGGRGRRGKQQNLQETAVEDGSTDRSLKSSARRQSPPRTSSTAAAISTNKNFVRLLPERLHHDSSSPIDVCVVQVNDERWWQEQEDGENSNPFGARLWPSSLACAQFLCQHINNSIRRISHHNDDQRLQHLHDQEVVVLEIGCGTGLVSIGAAVCGASVVATDISPIALRLTKAGWSETQKRCKKTRNNKNCMGMLSVSSFDLFSKQPLSQLLDATGIKPSSSSSTDPTTNSPLSGSSTPTQPIVVASAVLYDATLAKAIAHRVFEAVTELNAWVILGDCDTGLRENGREVFETELQKLYVKKKGTTPVTCLTSYQDVKQQEFGWANKPVQIIHYNPPDDVINRIGNKRDNRRQQTSNLEASMPT